MNVIITGATKGIGRAIAEHLYAHGANIAVTARTKSDLDIMNKELKRLNPAGQVITSICDASKKSQVEKFANRVLAAWPHIDVLINNVGDFTPGNILTEPPGALEYMIDVNLMSAYHLTRMIVPGMVEMKQGHIFNMCSVASTKAYPAGGAYGVSKYALLGFSENLREELKTKGIKVTAIIPGATWSNSWAGFDAERSRLMEAEDVAIAVKAALDMGPSAVLETITMRPLLGDI